MKNIFKSKLKTVRPMAILLVFTALSYPGWAVNTGQSVTKKTKSNIKYIDISIQQPGVDECLGVNVSENIPIEDWIQVFPNPNPGIFTLEIQGNNLKPPLSVKVFDMKGTLVFESTDHSFENGKNQEIDVSYLNEGIYFIRVTGQNKSAVKQIIIQ